MEVEEGQEVNKMQKSARIFGGQEITTREKINRIDRIDRIERRAEWNR